jgi:hypothetical protein
VIEIGDEAVKRVKGKAVGKEGGELGRARVPEMSDAIPICHKRKATTEIL